MLKTLGVHFIRHPCLCGRLGRCIVQRLCATAIVHPCTTRKLRVLLPAAPKIIPRLLSWRKCGGAGLSNRACSVGFASCETLGKHYRASLHDPYRASSHPPAPKKAGLYLFRHSPAFFGADGGGRTRTVLLPTDFESVTSANSITSAY